MVVDTSLLSNRHYKVCLKGKVEQSKELVAPSFHPRIVANQKEAFDYGR